MTEPRTNRLLRSVGEGGGLEPGTDAARQQLQDHCDRLNHMKGDRYWFVIKRDDKLTIDNGPRQTSAASPPASPEEVRRIMQQHGFR